MLLSKKKFKPKRKFRLSAPFAGALGSGVVCQDSIQQL
jgi:hypothetical protein